MCSLTSQALLDGEGASAAVLLPHAGVGTAVSHQPSRGSSCLVQLLGSARTCCAVGNSAQ